MTRIRYDRLRKLADFLNTLPRKNFCLSFIRGKKGPDGYLDLSTCGTVVHKREIKP